MNCLKKISCAFNYLVFAAATLTIAGVLYEGYALKWFDVVGGIFVPVTDFSFIKVMWKWCEKCGLKKGRALAVGAGGMAQAAPIGKGPMAKVGTALEQMAEDIKNDVSGDTIYTKPILPRCMYKIAGNFSFVAEGKKNGLSRKQIKGTVK